jgi:hypothetical protein
MYGNYASIFTSLFLVGSLLENSLKFAHINNSFTILFTKCLCVPTKIPNNKIKANLKMVKFHTVY